MFKLGQRLRDRVTGFVGIATSRTDYLNGCTRYCLEPPIGKDGKMPKDGFFDIQQLEFVDDGILVKSKKSEPAKASGGPGRSTPPRN